MHQTFRRNDESGAADRLARDGRRPVSDPFCRESLGIAA